MIFRWSSFKRDSFYFLENGKTILVYPSAVLPIKYLKLWKNRSKLNIKDPILSSLEITKEKTVKCLNEYYKNLLDTCSVVVNDICIQIKDIDYFKSEFNSNVINYKDKFGDSQSIDAILLPKIVSSIQTAMTEIKLHFEKNLKIIKESQTNEELQTRVYFFDYFETDSILDYSD